MQSKMIRLVSQNARFVSTGHKRIVSSYTPTFRLNRTPLYHYSKKEKLNNKQQKTKYRDDVETDFDTVKQRNYEEMTKEHQEVEDIKNTEDMKIKQAKRNLKKKMIEDGSEITTIKKKKTLMDKIRHEIQHLKKSLRDVKNDAKYAYGLRKEKKSLSNFALIEFVKYKSITYDLIKFLPYSIFLSIPLLEVFLPFYILLFPNSTPSQFYSEKSIGVKNERMTQKQIKGYKTLKKRLYSVLGQDYVDIKNVFNALKEDPDNEEMKLKLMELDKNLQNKLVNEWQANYSKKLSYNALAIEEKEALLKLFYSEYISGVYVINQIYNTPFYIYNFASRWGSYEKTKINATRWKLNFFPITLVKSLSFKIQLYNHMRRLKQEDTLLFKNPEASLEECTSLELFDLARRRGLKIQSDTDIKNFLRSQWSFHSQITDTNLKIWTILLRHEYADFLI